MQNIGKLQGSRTGEKDFARGSELDDNAFLHGAHFRLLLAIGVRVARELHRNAYWRCFGKKAGKVGDRAVLRRAPLSCGLLRQASDTFPLPVFDPELVFTNV